jgi:hypothetical protein
MKNTTATAMLRAAKSCIAEAQRADRLRQHTYAELLRGSARRALAVLDAATPRAVDPETAACRGDRARCLVVPHCRISQPARSMHYARRTRAARSLTPASRAYS